MQMPVRRVLLIPQGMLHTSERIIEPNFLGRYECERKGTFEDSVITSNLTLRARQN